MLAPLCCLIIPPAHLVWAVSLLFRHHPNILHGLLHLVVGFCVAEFIGICFTSLGSLSIRRILLQRFSEQGFGMSFLLTALLPATFVAYKAEELKRLHE